MAEGKIDKSASLEMSDAQVSARKKRNVAIGLCLALLVVVFYAGTWIKISQNGAENSVKNPNILESGN